LDFESFYRKEFDAVYRAAVLTARDPQQALDATQEAFEKAYARWWRLSRHEWAGGWVMTTALNLCKRQHRWHQRHVSAPTVAPPHLDTSLVELRELLAQLPLRQRQAITLFYVADMPIQAIAQVMRLSEGAVKTHLSRGRRHLKEMLGVQHE